MLRVRLDPNTMLAIINQIPSLKKQSHSQVDWGTVVVVGFEVVAGISVVVGFAVVWVVVFFTQKSLPLKCMNWKHWQKVTSIKEAFLYFYIKIEAVRVGCLIFVSFCLKCNSWWRFVTNQKSDSSSHCTVNSLCIVNYQSIGRMWIIRTRPGLKVCCRSLAKIEVGRPTLSATLNRKLIKWLHR